MRCNATNAGLTLALRSVRSAAIAFAWVAVLAIVSGCSSTGGGSRPPDLADQIMAQARQDAARLGLPYAPRNQRYTFTTKKADGKLGTEFFYWDYPQGKVGGLTYGADSTGPSDIVMPNGPDGSWSMTAYRHECFHAVNNDSYHIVAANGHPQEYSRVAPWWPYYTGPQTDTRFVLSPVTHQFEDGAAMCILLVQDRMVSALVAPEPDAVAKLATKLLKLVPPAPQRSDSETQPETATGAGGTKTTEEQ